MARTASPSPVHRQTSSMSPTAKPKKATNPRSKNNVRAKSGCYTCRIRRKKCDESHGHENGSCATCSRLRLQCLGWGPKRPDWLRGQESVQTIRDKIKSFLASQGMIKGHAGSGPRVGDTPLPVLQLEHSDASSSSSSPQSMTKTMPDAGDLMTHPNGSGGLEMPLAHGHGHPNGLDAQRAQESHLRGDSTGGLMYPGASMPPMNPQPEFSMDSMTTRTNGVLSDPMLGYAHSIHHTYSRHPSANGTHSNSNSTNSSPSSHTHHLPIPGHSTSPPPHNTPPHHTYPLHNNSTHPHHIHAPMHPQRTHHTSQTNGGSPAPSLGGGNAGTTIPPTNNTSDSRVVSLTGNPTRRSSFGPLYHQDVNEGEFYDGGRVPSYAGDYTNILVHAPATGVFPVGDRPPPYEHYPQSGQWFPANDLNGMYGQTQQYSPPVFYVAPQPSTAEYSLRYYLEKVLPKQFILAGPQTRDTVMRIFLPPGQTYAGNPVFSAITRLASIHQQKSWGNRPILPDNIDQPGEILGGTMQMANVHTAMASLHFVSYELFGGGWGPWEQYLNTARGFMKSWIIYNTNGNLELLSHVVQTAPIYIKFLLRTTMWFDVLACVSQGQESQFLRAYEVLFDQDERQLRYQGSRIEEVGREEETDESPELSMLHAMGCHNSTVLAITKISSLASRKTQALRTGTFSAPRLVEQGKAIEQLLSNGQDHLPQAYPRRDSKATHRGFTADIYRTSALIYLHTVLSGDYPQCPEIVESVEKTMKVLRDLGSQGPGVKADVARSVVFPLWITGCMAIRTEDKALIRSLLELDGGERHGNCGEVAKLLKESVWSKAPHKVNTTMAGSGSSAAVEWREALTRGGVELLLV